MMPLDMMTGTEALRAVGYDQRMPPRGAPGAGPGKREVYRRADGAIVGLMDAHEARAFAEKEWAAQRAPARP